MTKVNKASKGLKEHLCEICQSRFLFYRLIESLLDTFHLFRVCDDNSKDR